jgi:hypothetical protein
MRSEEEIREVFNTFDEAEQEELMNSKGDNFKYGFWVGKLTALGWMLGDPIADLKIHHDYQSYVLETRRARDDRSPIPPIE